MKKQFQHTLLATCILTIAALVAACRSEAPDTPTKGNIQVGGANITITAGDEGYGRESSRSARVLPQDKTIEWGNGLTADINIEEDTAEETRATKNLDGGGIYTIFAVDPTTHQKIMGANGRRKTLKGRFENGNFVPTGGGLSLEPGTYKFVCVNDAFTIDPTTHDLKYGHGKDAMMGITDAHTITAADHDYSIHFSMKHLCARIRVRLITYKQNLSSIRLQIGSRTYGDNLQVLYPDGTSKAEEARDGGALSSRYAFNYPLAATADRNPELGYAPYYTVGEYMYLLPHTINGKHSFLQFTSGTIYGKTIPTNEVYLDSALPSSVVAGASYTITFALNAFPVYLYTDGTVSMLEDRAGRTPVGLVVRHKKGDTDNQKKGLAIALTDAGTPGAEYIWSTIDTKVNDKQVDTASDAVQDCDGYHYTWDAMQGHTKANEQTNFPAFYYAAQYSPAVTGTNISKWFLPSIGEWALFFRTVKYTVTPTGGSGYALIELQNVPPIADTNLLFTQVGGTDFYTQSIHSPSFYNAYHTSSEVSNMGPCWFVDIRDPSYPMMLDGTARNDAEDMHVRSFVHF